MASESKSLRGKLQLRLDPALLAASLTLTVDLGGESWDVARVEGLLKAQGLRWGPESQGQIEDGFRALAKLDSGSQTVVALTGRLAGEPVADTLEWKSQPIPPELAAEGKAALAVAPAPRVFDIRVTKKKVEEIQRKKPALPFLKPKEEKVVRVVRHENRVEVGVDPKPQETGFARRNDVLAVVRPGRPGKEGCNLRGEPIPGRKPDRVKVLVGHGVALRGSEVRAEVDGFYRRGRNWIDLVPHRAGALRVYPSPDRGTCLLDFAPGTGRPPAADEVLAKAKEAGFAAADLVSKESIEELLARSAAESQKLVRHVLSRSRDGGFEIKVAPDRLLATLTLRKGSGEGKMLSLAEVGRAINAQGFKGLDTARVRQDILAFHRGAQAQLIDYVLVEGASPPPATGGAVQWDAQFVTPERAREIESRLGADSSDGFPVAAVEEAAFVKPGQPVGKLTPAAAGGSGRDVFGAVVAAPPGRELDLRLGSGLEVKGDHVTALAEGVLEIVPQQGAVFARVREYHEDEVAVRIADSRLEAYVSLFPTAGKPLAVETVKAAIAKRGVVKGVDDALLEDLVARASRGETVRDALVAKGSAPVDQKSRGLSFRGSVVMGRSFLLASPSQGSRAQNLTVKEGQDIAEIEPPQTEAQDGYDVLGALLPARRAPALDIETGPNVDRRTVIRFVAKKAGEVFYDGTLLDVRDTLVVEEAVGAAGAPVRFSGSVEVRGSVTNGARVFSGGDVHVAQMVERAVVSSEGSVSVGGGIKGGGGAILRAKNDISATYAEQATLLAVGEIRIKNSCLQCQVRCNSRVVLDGEKAAIIGGRIKARAGVKTRHIGSEKRARTEISFGQDYLVEDQIGVEAREIEKLKAQVASLDVRLAGLDSADSVARRTVEQLSREKVRCLKALEQRTMRFFSLREKFETHFPSEVVVEGTLHPGVVFESHGRTLEVDSARAGVVVSFDQATGRITVRPLDGRG